MSPDLDFRAIVEQADVGLCVTRDGRFAYVNPKFAEMHGTSQAALVGRELYAVVHESARTRVAEIRRLRELGLHHAPYESRNVRADGSAFDSRIYGRTITYDGQLANLTTVSDISELSRAHRVSAWRARMLVSTEALCGSGSVEIVDGAGRIRSSAGMRKVLLLDDAWAEVPLRAALRLVHAEDRVRLVRKWRAARPGVPFQASLRLARADGSWVGVTHRGLMEVVDGEEGLRPVAILQDVTEQQAAQSRIERLINHHPVTGLATRQLIRVRTRLAVETAVRENRPLAMLHLRVPELQRVHDVLGSRASEAIATVLARRLLEHARSADTVGHIGSGEFCVLLDPVAGADEPQALRMAEGLLAALTEPVPIEGTEVVIEGLIGLARFPGDASSVEELIEHARGACGKSGRTISFFSREAGASAARRIRIEAGLRRAFERGELTLHYQPQVDLRDGRIAGVEALLRWTSKEFGAVSPSEFIPIAEESGLVVNIGEWVWKSACEQSVAWSRAGLPVVRIGVNLSPRQLELPDIAQRLQSVLLATGADPRHMGIEITESVLTRDLEHARRTLVELSAIGVEIALDDFGTGYSNLQVLRALPFDVIKIDRSLVHDVTAQPEDVSITRAVLMLARGLKIKVLAEGVETEGQLSLLVSNGCDMMQGHIFSRPLPAPEIEAMLAAGRCLPEQLTRNTGRRRTLLLVDDEENVLSSLRRLLRGSGCRIVTARSGEEGLARLAEQEVDVIISDQRMPGMTGVEFLRRTKALYPDTVRLVLSGYTELQTITDAVNEGAIYKFLTKPWDDALLRTHVEEAFRRKEMADENVRLSAENATANHRLAQANERLEALLARQREQLSLEEVRALNAQDLLENLPTAILGIDAGGTVAFANRAAQTLMRATSVLVGCAVEEVLPPDWIEAWRDGSGQHRASRVGNRRCLVACTPMNQRSPARGHLLSIIPTADVPEEVLP